MHTWTLIHSPIYWHTERRLPNIFINIQSLIKCRYLITCDHIEKAVCVINDNIFLTRESDNVPSHGALCAHKYSHTWRPLHIKEVIVTFTCIIEVYCTPKDQTNAHSATLTYSLTHSHPIINLVISKPYTALTMLQTPFSETHVHSFRSRPGTRHGASYRKYLLVSVKNGNLNYSKAWLTDWLTDWLTGWLAAWLTDWLAGWLVGSLAHSLTHSLNHSLNHSINHSLNQSINHCLTDSPTDSLTHSQYVCCHSHKLYA